MRMSIFAAVSAVALMAGAAHAAPVVDTPALVAQDPGFTDDELKSFGTAMGQLGEVAAQVQGGTPTAEQQAEMASIVQNSGLTIDRFNAISNAVSADPVLQARVAVVMAPPSPAGSVAASVTDEEVEKFSAAISSIQAIAATVDGTPTAEQQAEMAAIVEGSGMTIERFNAISNAVSTDTTLQARMRLADAERASGTSGAQ
mgnify:CR=1 FL=1